MNAPHEHNLTVLYIAGYGRSGSTLLDRILDQQPGFFAAGEVDRIWSYGYRDNLKCTCGERFFDCAFWSQVHAVAFGGRLSPTELSAIFRLRDTLRMRRFPRLCNNFLQDSHYRAQVAEYADIWTRLLNAMAEVARAEVIVDSSKTPVNLQLLARMPVNLKVLHLVRDSRAVAFSYERAKLTPESSAGRLIKRSNIFSTAFSWLLWNGLVEAQCSLRGQRYRLTYEKLVNDLAHEIERILAFVGASFAVPLGNDNDVVLGTGHSLAGNPMRFSSGNIRVTLDREWSAQMPLWKRRVVTALTYPLLRRYGYV